jgi:hypothetical protein
MASRAAFTNIQKRYEGMKTHVEKVKAKAEETAEKTLQVAEVGIGTFGFSYANARYGKPDPKRPGVLRIQVAGVDADLIAAGGGILFALMGGAGKQSDHIHNVAVGAAGSYLARLGTELGAAALVKANQAGGAASTGAMGPRPPGWEGVKTYGVDYNQNPNMPR